jgi:hypothetical protein
MLIYKLLREIRQSLQKNTVKASKEVLIGLQHNEETHAFECRMTFTRSQGLV